MTDKRHVHAAAYWHVDDIAARVVAESGNPSDRFHLGKIILQSLKDSPDMIGQIDAATGQSETNGSLLQRSIQCAIAFRKLGLQPGDVIILVASNHLDVAVPLYAALFEGIAVASVERGLPIADLRDSFKISTAKVIFCENEKLNNVEEALNEARTDAKVITFDTNEKHDTFAKLLSLGENVTEVANYRAVNIDPAESFAMIIPTSGTTGLPKFTAATHKNFVVMTPNFWSRTTEIPHFKRSFMLAPLQWSTSLINFVSCPIMRMTRIQSSSPSTQMHVYDIINNYKPDTMIISPPMLNILLNPQDRDKCDFTCFKTIFIGGSAVYRDLIAELKVLSPETEAVNMYGMSEVVNMAFQHGHSSPPESCGKPIITLQYRLVDPDTGADINEPNKNGELWLKGPGVFKCYYNNPEATEKTFTEDRWFKTGDLLYRDESWNYFFVERIKLLMKYRNHRISPVEIERVIIQHPGVLDVAVTAIQDEECEDLPVACVVRKPGYDVTAQEIKDLVIEKLGDVNQLRGGVVFFDKLPMNASTKIHRRKLREMVLNMEGTTTITCLL